MALDSVVIVVVFVTIVELVLLPALFVLVLMWAWYLKSRVTELTRGNLLTEGPLVAREVRNLLLLFSKRAREESNCVSDILSSTLIIPT